MKKLKNIAGTALMITTSLNLAVIDEDQFIWSIVLYLISFFSIAILWGKDEKELTKFLEEYNFLFSSYEDAEDALTEFKKKEMPLGTKAVAFWKADTKINYYFLDRDEVENHYYIERGPISEIEVKPSRLANTLFLRPC